MSLFVKPIKMKLLLAAVVAVVVLGVAQGEEECRDQLGWCEFYAQLCYKDGFKDFMLSQYLL